MRVSTIINKYRERNSSKKKIGFAVRYMRQSSRDVAAELNELLQPHNLSVTHATICNWEDDKHVPKLQTLQAIMAHEDKEDWRVKMATELYDEIYA